MKRLIVIVLVIVMVLTLGSGVASAVSVNGAERGVCEDENALWLGEITYLANKSGGHLWFTPTADGGPYIAGHRYHNVYKYNVDDPSEWAIVPVVPDRLPYNKIATPGEPIYYKIFDTTTDTQVVP